MSVPIDEHGNLILPENKNEEWERTVLRELLSRLDVLEDSVDESGYEPHGECQMIVRGLLEYHGGTFE